MSKADDYLDTTNLFTPKQIAKAAGCPPVLILKYIQEGIRGVGALSYEFVNDLGQPMVSIAALSEFGLRHTGYARSYALKAVKALKGANHESH